MFKTLITNENKCWHLCLVGSNSISLLAISCCWTRHSSVLLVSYSLWKIFCYLLVRFDKPRHAMYNNHCLTGRVFTNLLPAPIKQMIFPCHKILTVYYFTKNDVMEIKNYDNQKIMIITFLLQGHDKTWNMDIITDMRKVEYGSSSKSSVFLVVPQY